MREYQHIECQPVVSVVTPCYNDGLHIMDTVNSVKHSSYPNIEHIIINDGSNDTYTLNVLDKLRKDSSVKIIDTKNQGVCKARNQAIRESKGKYLLPVDGDDLISVDYISLAVAELELSSEIKVVATNYKYFGKLNSEIKLEPFSLQTLISHNIFTVSSMFRREDFDRIGGFKECFDIGLEDWDFWISILKEGGQVVYLDGINFMYRIKAKKKSRNSSVMKDSRIRKIRYLIWNNHKELYSNYFLDPIECFEYTTMIKSKEYQLGKLLLSPIRQLFKL